MIFNITPGLGPFQDRYKTVKFYFSLSDGDKQIDKAVARGPSGRKRQVGGRKKRKDGPKPETLKPLINLKKSTQKPSI